MARQNTIQFLRTTRANLDAKASASELVAGEPYLITDEQVMAVGLTSSTYKDIGPVDDVLRYGEQSLSQAQQIQVAKNLATGAVKLAEIDESGTAGNFSLDLTGLTDFCEFQFYLYRVQAVADSKRPWLSIASDVGGFEGANGDYEFCGVTYNDGSSNTANFNSSTIDGVTDKVILTDNPLGSGSDETGDFVIRIIDPFHDKKRRFNIQAHIHDDGGVFRWENSAGAFKINNVTPIDTVYIGFTGTNIKAKGVVLGIPSW